MHCAATKSLLNPSSMVANSCIISLASLSTTSTNTSLSYPYLRIQSRPIKLHLSCSTSLFSSKQRTNRLPTIDILAVAAQQEEDNTLVLEDQEAFSWDNQSEADGEEEEEKEGVVEAIGESNEYGEAEAEEEYAEPPEDAKLFVGNLPYDVDSEMLAQLFNQAGVVEISEVIYNRETDQSRGFGFVTMSTVEEAEKAVEIFNRYDLNGRFLTVNKAAPRGSRPERQPRTFEPAYRIYVGNLPWGVDDARLEQVFSEHGKVITARVVLDKETGRSRGFGFVTMATEAEMNDAIANLDGQSLDGRAIRVNVAEQKPRGGSFSFQ